MAASPLQPRARLPTAPVSNLQREPEPLQRPCPRARPFAALKSADRLHSHRPATQPVGDPPGHPLGPEVGKHRSKPMSRQGAERDRAGREPAVQGADTPFLLGFAGLSRPPVPEADGTVDDSKQAAAFGRAFGVANRQRGEPKNTGNGLARYRASSCPSRTPTRTRPESPLCVAQALRAVDQARMSLEVMFVEIGRLDLVLVGDLIQRPDRRDRERIRSPASQALWSGPRLRDRLLLTSDVA